MQHQVNESWQWEAILSVTSIGLIAVIPLPAQALDRANPAYFPGYEELLQLPLVLEPDEELLAEEVITDSTISTTSLTPPSLWWQQEQTSLSLGAPQQLLNTWIAFQGSSQEPRRIDLVINPQIWEALTYLEHYILINQFGTAAKSFGYSLRVFSSGRLVGANWCDFLAYGRLSTLDVDNLPETELIDNVRCTIVLDYLGRGSL